MIKLLNYVTHPRRLSVPSADVRLLIPRDVRALDRAYPGVHRHMRQRWL